MAPIIHMHATLGSCDVPWTGWTPAAVTGQKGIKERNPDMVANVVGNLGLVAIRELGG
ncbi:hypothetical protein ACP4OV_020365 [Aristida adscensionis]